MGMETKRRTINPTVRYLRGALRADRKIDALIERSVKYRHRAEQATGRITATRNSGTGRRSQVEDSVIALVDLSRELVDQAETLAAKVREIEAVIDQVEDDRYRDLLKWRYLNGWTWERITEAMGRENVSWTHELHGYALREVEKNLPYHMETNT